MQYTTDAEKSATPLAQPAQNPAPLHSCYTQWRPVEELGGGSWFVTRILNNYPEYGADGLTEDQAAEIADSLNRRGADALAGSEAGQ